MKYWQHSGGNGIRNYVDICLKYGVILSGPGYAGYLDDESILRLKSDGVTQEKINVLIRFRDSIRVGDFVVLRVGLTNIYGVGIVIGEYEWSNIFSDVDGWDLQHFRRVKWLMNNNDASVIKSFPNMKIKRGLTTQELNSLEVIEWIKTLDLNNQNKKELPKLPQESVSEVSIEEISDYLFSKGVSGTTVRNLIETLSDLHMIAKWYKKVENPSEFETQSYLIIPLLRVLGWTPQKMAIEYSVAESGDKQRIDIAIFGKLPRDSKNLIVIVEAKKIGDSCLTAYTQAAKYAKSYKLCNRLIVSDGLRYGIFVKNDTGFSLSAYMNLTSFKDNYEIYECFGIKEALWLMSPEWTDNEEY